MAGTNYVYSIVEVQRENVLDTINEYGYEIHAMKIDTRTYVNVSKDVSVGELKEMVSTTDYLYFYISAKPVETLKEQ